MIDDSAHIDRFVIDGMPPACEQPEFLFDLPELQYPERLNAAVELLASGAGDSVAVENDSGSWTYAELDRLSDRIAALLDASGLIPGGRVLLRGPNTMTMFACWLAILKAGGVVVATMPILRAGEVSAIIERAEVDFAIVDERGQDDFVEGVAQSGRRVDWIAYRGDAGGGPLEQAVEEFSTPFAAVATHRDDPALLAFTSGTTGEPKACIHFHRDVLASADSFARYVLKPTAEYRWLCSAPLAFTFGLGMQFIFPLRFGGTVVTLDRPGAEPMLDGIESHRVTVIATAPTAYRAMVPLLEGRDLSSLRTCVSAGEHLPAATWEAWKQATGLSIVDGIGATEMMHIFISANGDDIRPGSTGLAVPGYRATVLDDDGQPMETGTGRLAVQGPTGCRYFADARQRNYVVDGWNVTGDTYHKDEDGYFWYVARSDDMIISSGYNIAGPEVENALLSHPAVAECAVVGQPCEERGQRVTAYIVPAPGHEEGPELASQLQEHVKARIAPYKYPRDVRFVAALPKTATGKLQRFALREDDRT